MLSSEFFHVKIANKLAFITFVRPPMNMISLNALGQRETILNKLALMKDISVIVITGGVEGYFIAHADVEDVMRMENEQPPAGDPDSWGAVGRLLSDMPQLTVAAVNGQAWGGGCELALACNLLLLSESGHLRLLEVSKGVIPGAGGTQRLARRIGVPRALQMILSAEVVDSHTALQLGLADAVLTASDFLACVQDWLETILNQPVHSVHAAKSTIIKGIRLPLEDGLRLEKEVFSQLVCCDSTKALGEKTAETLEI